jgi:Fumarase C-terminus
MPGLPKLLKATRPVRSVLLQRVGVFFFCVLCVCPTCVLARMSCFRFFVSVDIFLDSWICLSLSVCLPLTLTHTSGAGRMDSYVDLLMEHGGSMISLAKGNRSSQVRRACKKHGGFYLGSIGGPAAILAKNCIKNVEVLEYPELGMEAIWKIDVVDFPAFIITNDKVQVSVYMYVAVCVYVCGCMCVCAWVCVDSHCILIAYPSSYRFAGSRFLPRVDLANRNHPLKVPCTLHNLAFIEYFPSRGPLPSVTSPRRVVP